MTRRRDPLRLGSHWHVDCRLEAELPDDNIVSLNFFANALFGSFALALMLFTGWLGYKAFNLHQQTKNWERGIAESASEVREIQVLQREYVTEASKIDQAYGTIRPKLNISDFVAALSRTLPSEVTVDMVEWNESGIVVRGYLREPIQKASGLLGDYVDVLRKHEKIAPNFQEIRLTGIERAKGNEELQSFGLKFGLKPLPPL
jgi:hypothetical protein